MARIPTTVRPSPAVLVLVVAVAGFVLFGMRDGSLGVAWPSMRASFGQPLAALGLLVLASLGGYLIASTASGRLASQLAGGDQLVLASCGAVAGLAAFALSSTWLLLLPASVLLGAANAIVDVNVNAHLALRHGAGTVNLVHAGWGLGTTLGPILITVALVAQASWRVAYLVLLCLEGLLLAGFLVTRRAWTVAAPQAPPFAGLAGRGRRSLPATLALFFVYSGLEIGAGQWAYTFFVDGHGLSVTLAGAAVAAYWGGFTAFRLVASALGTRLPPTRMLDLSLGATLAGAGVVFVYPGAIAAVAGLVLMGAGLAAVFPTLVALTPARAGSGPLAAVMGYQLSAAALGAALLSALTGLALERFGPRSLGAILVAGAAALIVTRAFTRSLES